MFHYGGNVPAAAQWTKELEVLSAGIGHLGPTAQAVSKESEGLSAGIGHLGPTAKAVNQESERLTVCIVIWCVVPAAAAVNQRIRGA